MYSHERSLVTEMQGRPFVLLGVNNDEKIKTAKKAVKKNKLNWRSFYDGRSREITGPFRIKGYPTIMLIDHIGKIVHANTRLRGEKLDDFLVELVKTAEDAGMTGDAVKMASIKRTFRDSTGKHRIVATATALIDGMVTLEKEDGSIIELALDKLSRTDQRYLETVELDTGENASETEDSIVMSDEDSSDSEIVSELRVFVDSTGKHEVKARFVSLDGGKVTLALENGKTTVLELEKLSDDDQTFVKSQK